jgi:hypothetical protein
VWLRCSGADHELHQQKQERAKPLGPCAAREHGVHTTGGVELLKTGVSYGTRKPTPTRVEVLPRTSQVPHDL